MLETELIKITQNRNEELIKFINEFDLSLINLS